MTRTRRFRATLLLIAMLGVMFPARTARASDPDPDPWFGRDKALHFGVSAVIASSTYAIMTTQFRPRYQPLLISAGFTLAIGAGKEGLDALGYGDPSWKDFAWDVIGTVVGLGVGWGIDLAARGVSSRAPLFGAPGP